MLARVNRNDRHASVRVPEEMMAAADTHHVKARPTQSGEYLFAAKSRESAHVSTSIR
jgi:hypothetical protein